jgi:hypothetical protein
MTGTATRRAALALHGLAAEDREWVWSHLATMDQEKLSPFLDELVELGFPGDVSDLLDTDQTDDEPLHDSHSVEFIDAATPKIVHRVLKDEQVATLALVIDYHPWRWRKRVMRRLGRPRSHAIRQALWRKDYALAEPVRHEVIESLAKAIADEANRSSPVTLSGLRGMIRW